MDSPDSRPPGDGARRRYGFLDFPVPHADPEVWLTELRGADWSAFTPVRDLPPLRAALVALEQAYGVTEAHRFATGRIRAAGAVLRHPDAHPTEIHAFALSPCGRHLAVGSHCGDDYDRGGTLQIWEVSTGRCVNVLDGIRGGIGWPGYPGLVQWSADGRRIAAAFATNVVGVWDPFGDSVEPIGAAAVTDGAGRPPGFALAPDGTRAYVQVGFERQVSGCLVSLTNGWVYDDEVPDDEGHDGDDGQASVSLLVDTLPDWAEDETEPRWLYPEQSLWSRDGSRIFARAEDGEVYAIDVDSRQVCWLVDTGTPKTVVSWSPDQRLLAYQSQGRLVIAHTATGRPIADLPERPGASELRWGDRNGLGRLAVVIPAGNEPGARPTVAVYDEGQHRYDLDVALAQVETADSDHTAWAWAPDGDRAACLTATGRIEIWSLTSKPQRQRVVDAAEDTSGVLWGADDVIIATGGTTLRFIQATTGDMHADVTFLRQPPSPRPLELDRADTGDDIRRDLGLDPTFALTADTWAVAFETGIVIAPETERDALDATLAWTVGRRYAWPTRWGDLDVVPDAATAADRLGPPLAPYLDRFRGRLTPTATPWPPPNTATLEDLYQAALGSVRSLDAGWNTTVSENLLIAARLRARRGEATGARELVAAIPINDLRAKAAKRVERFLAAASGDPGAVEQAEPASRPTQAEISALAEAYSTLQALPRGQRGYPTRQLIDQAAECRHISAVLDLLARLPDDNFNDRPGAAFRALRTITREGTP
jgi:WD40 repeat protein